MLIKYHMSGVAIAYEPHGKPFDGETKFQNEGRYQGSRYNQQKRKVADAVAYMLLCGHFRPVIFVATSPGYIADHRQKGYIKALTHYLRNSCGCRDYVWVRERTKKGFSHYHFIADMPFPKRRDDFRALAIDMSRYWSSLFGVSADNSVRFGTKPPKRKFFIDSLKMATYMSKYIGKAMEGGINARGYTIARPGLYLSAYIVPYVRCRRYDISRNARQCSEPVTFAKQLTFYGDASTYMADVYDPEGVPHCRTFNPDNFQWRKCKEHMVWIGRPKSGNEKSLKSTVKTQKIAAPVG